MFKMRIAQHLMLLLLVSCVGFSADHCNQPLTWSEADACCRSWGQTLPVVRNHGDVHAVSGLASARDMVSFWVALKKKRLSRWTWIDGTLGSSTTVVDSSLGECVTYLPETRALKAVKCNSQTGGLLCEIQGCSDCKCGKWLPTCVLHNNKSFVYLCQDLTWHQARAYCAREGWRLAVFPGSTIRGSPREVYCDHFWVGLRRKDWKHTYGQDRENVEKMYTLWDEEEPNSSGDCSLLNLTTSGWRLRAQSCQRKRNFICVDVKESTSPKETLTTEKNTGDKWKPQSPSPERVVIGIVGGVASAAFLASLCTIVFLVYRRRDRSRSLNLEQNQESLIPLTEVNASHRKWIQEVLTASMIHRYGKINLWSWFEDHVTVDMNELYTDLVWTKRHDLNTSHKIKEYTDMFKVGDQQWSQTNIFLAGDAGTGKSTFVRKIATDWCKIVHSKTKEPCCVDISSEGQEIMKQFEIVILLCFRDIKKKQSIIGAIKEQLDLKENDAVFLYRLIQQNQLKTLLIFDGYDEYRDFTSKDITDILQRRKLQYTNLLITSRHPRSFHFKTDKILCANEVCLRGFSDEGTSVFIGKFFVSDERGNELKEQISNSPYLAYLSHFPAVLLLMAILWRDTRKLSYSITGFYEDFVKYICGRYEQKFIGKKNRARPEIIIWKYHYYFMKIGKIAVSGMKKDKLELSFPFDSVKTALGKTGWNLGFFAQEDRPGAYRMVAFPHKTLQEYFVAYYLIHVEDRKQNELLIMFCDSKQAIKESEMILTFVQGLGGEKIHKQIQKIFKDDDETAELHVDLQLNYLSQYQDARFVLPSVVKLETNKYPIKMYVKYLENDTSALTRLILRIQGRHRYEENTSYEELLSQAFRTKVIEELTIKETYLSTIDKIIEYLPNSKMEKLSLRLCRLSSQQVVPLLDKLPDSPSLADLDISHNDLRGLMDRTKRLTLTRCHLTTLNMSGCDLTLGDVRSLLVTLPDCPSLTNLDISANRLKDVMDETDNLTALIGRYLTTLNMRVCYLSSCDVRPLFDRLPECHSLTDLDLSCNYLRWLMEETDNPPGLTHSHLTTLNMSECYLTSREILSLLRVIPSGLTNLDVSVNEAGEELEKITNMTGQLTNLRELNLQNNYIHEEVVVQIRGALSQKCPNLNLLIDEQVF